MLTRATTELWERLVTERLERIDPIRSRWLQEHPNRTVILQQLVAEADDALHDMNDTQRDGQRSILHSSIAAADRPREVVAILLDSVELWSMITERWPNPTTTPGPPTVFNGDT